MKNLSPFVVIFALVGCAGSNSSPTSAGIAEYATWDLTVTSASPSVDTSPVTTSKYRCSNLLTLGTGPGGQIGFYASFTRDHGRPRELRILGFRPETLVVGQEITFGTGGGIQGGIIDWQSDTGPERDGVYSAREGGVRVIAVDDDRTTFEIDARCTDTPGNVLFIRGTYSFRYDKRADFVSFNPCPARL